MKKTDAENEICEEIEVEESSGNVFADLGLKDADELLFKADLLFEIQRIIKEKRLTQAKAAKILAIEQPDVSALMHGRIRGYSSDRLMKFLTALDQDVEIVIKARHTHGPKAGGKISVSIAG